MFQDPYLPLGVSERDISPPENRCTECGSEDLEGEADICEDCRWRDLLMEPIVYTLFCPVVGTVRQVIEQREDTISYRTLTADGKWECSRSTHECDDLEAGLWGGRWWLREHRKASPDIELLSGAVVKFRLLPSGGEEAYIEGRDMTEAEFDEYSEKLLALNPQMQRA